MSNSLKGGSMWEYIGDFYRGYTRSRLQLVKKDDKRPVKKRSISIHV